MSFTKKKPRKKRQPAPELPMTDEEKAKIQYKDEFQTNIGGKIEELGRKLEGKGRVMLYGVAAIAALLIIAALFYVWSRRTDNAAQAALGDAIETSQAQVTDSPLPAGVTLKTFKTEKERAEAAIKEFQAVADKYGGSYAEKAQYFIALSRLEVDRAAGIKELESLSAGSDEVSNMSKFALAQTYSADGKYPEAEKIYSELSKAQNPVISLETVRFELAKVYEKQKKNKEAADLYFQIAKEASEAKDSENNPVPLSQTAVESKERLKELDPERAKQIQEPETPALPFG